jgi:hypothetical protein
VWERDAAVLVESYPSDGREGNPVERFWPMRLHYLSGRIGDLSPLPSVHIKHLANSLFTECHRKTLHKPFCHSFFLLFFVT